MGYRCPIEIETMFRMRQLDISHRHDASISSYTVYTLFFHFLLFQQNSTDYCIYNLKKFRKISSV